VVSATTSDRDLEGKLVVVAGLGVSGRSATALALDRGATVIGIDSNEQLDLDSWLAEIGCSQLSVELGPCKPQTLKEASLLVC